MPSFPVLRGREAILNACDANPFVSCFVAEDAEGLAADGAVTWTRFIHDRTAIMGDGEPAVMAGLVTAGISRWRPRRLSIPQEGLEFLPEPLRPESVNRWHWFYTRVAPPADPAEEPVTWLGEADFGAIARLLDVAFPGASSRPDPTGTGHRWFGVRDARGTLTACGQASVGNSRAPMLSSVAVHPAARRRGLGSAITSWVTRRLLAEGHPMVTLGSYTGEDATHRVYRRLGYRDIRVIASGSLTAPN